MELADLTEPIKIASAIHRQIEDAPLPVPVEEIASAVGVTEIRDVVTDSFEGGLIANLEKSEGVILVNAQSWPTRRRYTLGHELGHFLNPWHKPRHGDQFLCSTEDMRRVWSGKTDRATRMEVEANQFSAELILPRERFFRAIQKHVGADLAYVLELATDYGTSKEATARRYVDLHEDPLAVVFSKEGRIRYSHRGQDFPFLEASPGAQIPSNSYSARGKTVSGEASDWEEVDAGVWLADGGNYIVSEQTLNQRDGHKITLLAIDENEEADEDDDLIDAWTPRFRRR